jgi:hypothetical protein
VLVLSFFVGIMAECLNATGVARFLDVARNDKGGIFWNNLFLVISTGAVAEWRNLCPTGNCWNKGGMSECD